MAFTRDRAADGLTDFHASIPVRDWGDGHAFRVGDALTGVCVFGATGSGKTSGPAKHLAQGYLAADFGGLVLCAKAEERTQWQQWAAATGRTNDLVIFDKHAEHTFNFLEWEARRKGEGGGLTMNIVALLDEIAGALDTGGGEGGGGDGRFFEDALHHLNMNLVSLLYLAGRPITMKGLRDIVTSAPLSPDQAGSNDWWTTSECASVITAAEEQTERADPEVRADLAECCNYWLREFPTLSDRTRSVIVLYFSMLVQPFNTSPLRKLFAELTNITPEECFAGKIIIVDLPVQEFRLAGKLANLAWKYCFQVAVLRRSKQDGANLRPVFLWADEAQNFVTPFDAEYQAVARSAGGCTVYLTQNRESFRRVLKSDDRVDSLLGNLQAKFFCQNGSIDTNEWASKLFGQRWTQITTRTGAATTGRGGSIDNHVGATAGFSVTHHQRDYVEPSEFATLRRGGDRNDRLVDCYVYNGGELYKGPDGKEDVPYKFLTFMQSLD